ncbi:MAG: GxxExxY protein [Planctomycetota bacterium]|jgi:GxxExxY protein
MTEWVGKLKVASDLPAKLEQVAEQVIGAAIEVHRHLGPGLLESVYERALMYELETIGLSVHQQVPVAVAYKDIEIGGQRLDLLVDPGVIIEIKAIEHLTKTHEAQLLSYLKSTGHRLGLLINFGQRLLKDGVKRIAN